jgi:thiamine-phosphate pyrophosphorylase
MQDRRDEKMSELNGAIQSGLARRERTRAAFDTDLYGITAEAFSLGRSNVGVVGQMLEAGVKLVQYREKEKETGDKYKECREIRRLTREAGAVFIVNDHPDLALMVEADGVHLGQDDYPIEAVRGLVGEEMMIGISTHAPGQAEEAIRRGADYIGVGPLFTTFTKKGVCKPVGIEYLDYAVQNVSIAFVAIGGIKTHNLGEVRRHGARCISIVTEIVGAPDIRGKIMEIRAVLKGS